MISIHIFCKAPVPGRTKTRLIPLVGREGAARAQERLLRHVVEVSRQYLELTQAGRLYLWCDPDVQHPLFRRLVPESSQRKAQPPGDLGMRMAHATRFGLQGSDGVILIGGDAGCLDLSILEQVVDGLAAGHDAVLGPAEDGGYVLFGLGRFHEEIFRDIPWGSPTVAQVTRERLDALSFRWMETPVLWDVDSPRDWARFQDFRR